MAQPAGAGGNAHQAQNELDYMIHQGRAFSGKERNCCFLNTGGARFANFSVGSGINFADDARAIAQLDWDHDGDLDLWITNRNAPGVRLLRNELPGKQRFLSLRLQGNGATTNRDAIGARVELFAAGLGQKRLIRTLRAGEGYLSQSSKWVHFGLGQLKTIDRLEVHWPGGTVESFQGCEVDRRYLLVQGTGQPQPQPTGRSTQLSPSKQRVPASKAAARVPLLMRLPLSKQATYLAFDGSPRPVPSGTGQPLLICLWASRCEPCLRELKQFSLRAAEIRQAGIEVLALALDGVGKDKSTPARAAARIRNMQFPFPAGSATEELAQFLEGYHHLQMVLEVPLPIPTSFLFDGQGRMKVVYKGPVEVDELLADASYTPQSDKQSLEWVAFLPGTALGLDPVAKREAKTLFNLAEVFEGQRRVADAAGFYRVVLERVPDSAITHFRLGRALAQQRQTREAVACFQQATQLDPDYLEAHMAAATMLDHLYQLEAAATHYRAALEIDPTVAAARQRLHQIERTKKSRDD